ncbi:hypothetical protein [Magnetospirillum sp. 15-1]|uniref:hypothetical protein n=1 Tax=Magnetospirillum sp. 15-1 TaxID=1979370 RepID=UPI001143106B|nr:hypothetical protein [Magnetospirillum sp. 15-1]
MIRIFFAVLALFLPPLSWPALARPQSAGAITELSQPNTREHLANVRSLPLSRLLGLCGEVKKMMILDGQLGSRPLTQNDLYVVSNGTKCLAATSAIFETLRVVTPLYGEQIVCMPEGVKDEEILAGLLEWLEERDREGADDIFRQSAPQAFIIYIRQAYPCPAR